jgi:hypothetical protein
MNKNRIYAHFSAGRTTKMSRRSTIWKKHNEICKKLERMHNFKAGRHIK